MKAFALRFCQPVQLTQAFFPRDFISTTFLPSVLRVKYVTVPNVCQTIARRLPKRRRTLIISRLDVKMLLLRTPIAAPACARSTCSGDEAAGDRRIVCRRYQQPCVVSSTFQDEENAKTALARVFVYWMERRSLTRGVLQFTQGTFVAYTLQYYLVGCFSTLVLRNLHLKVLDLQI